ncbi:MAG TPA: DegT/DnrJ/EryC1/StrS family aminotransferase [Elusimicrobiota bacterium]|nr:DegT/DnrJ/EryC1/StrS family aminotransferase [Elusimicrobiota bacterium]
MTAQRTIPFGRPWIGDEERRAVEEVLRGDVLAHGPQGKAFEAEFAAVLGEGAHVVSVSSGMAALHLSYYQMGLGPGDEVLVPALTHTATVHAVEIMGARPVFVDCEPRSGNVDVSKMESLITPRTKAIGIVHFLGVPCPMEEIVSLAERHGLHVVEDCALALGTRLKGKHAGLFGDSGCFSFYPVKHITTGEGGMFVTRHKSVAGKVSKARAFGVDRSFSERTIPGMYDVLSLGLNYRMSDINAALGRVQLTRLPEILRRRRANFAFLKDALKGSGNISVLDGGATGEESSCYCLSVVLEGPLGAHRAKAVFKLNEAGIGTSVYYPQPVPRMTYYREKYGYRPEDYRQAARISDQSIALPVGPHLTADDLDYIVTHFKRVIKEVLP